MSDQDSGFNWKDFSILIYGAIIGSAPMWIIVYALVSTGLSENEDITLTVFMISTFISGIISGYFVRKATNSDNQSQIAIVALLSYLITTLIFNVYNFSTIFMVEAGIIAAYVLGGTFGTRLWERVGDEYEYIEVEIDEDEEEPDQDTPEDEE